MNKVERFIRFSPKLFIVAGGLDFIKHVQILLPFWFLNRDLILSGQDHEFNHSKGIADLIYLLIDVITYPLAWIGSAIIITLLLQIYDRGRTPDA